MILFFKCIVKFRTKLIIEIHFIIFYFVFKCIVKFEIKLIIEIHFYKVYLYAKVNPYHLFQIENYLAIDKNVQGVQKDFGATL